MRKAIITVVVLSILTMGCKHSDKPVEPIDVTASGLPIAVPTPSASPAAKVKAVEQIVFTEKEPDLTFERISKLIRDYQQKLIQAINTNTFSTVEPYLAPGSSLYTSQKELVANLYSRKIKERFVATEIYGYYVEKDRYKVEVTERIEVDHPDRAPRINEYQWFYTVQQVEGKLLLSRLDGWTTYKQDMDQRSGSVKADGYYVEELLHNYPKILEKAINTLDITEIKRFSKNETVFAKQKELIMELRRKGADYSLQASSVQEDWNTLSFVQQLYYQYTDIDSRKQSGSQKLFFQMDEIREHFQGYAVIGYMQNASIESDIAKSGSVISYQIATIHPTMPEYLFKVYGRANSPKPGSLYNADKIEVYNAGQNGRLIQEIQFKPTHTWNGRSLGVIIEDMNFDGYLDIRIQSGTPAGPNIPYLYWLWDPKSSTYVANPNHEQIMSPAFDSDSQTIQSSIRESPTFYSDHTYRYIDGIPILIKRIEREADTEKKVWHITIKELVNQQLKVTGQYEETLSGR